MAVKVLDVTSILDFVGQVDAATTEGGSRCDCWYRGITSTNYKLQPSLFRHPSVTDAGKLIELEAKLISRFRQRSVPFLSKVLGDEWDCLFLMQHFGVPTRLLDWSESPFVALYFAVTGDTTGANDAAVWILRPDLWNQAALRHVSYSRGALSVSDQELRGYRPPGDTSLDMMNKHPVAMYGTHNSPRIVAQRGVFTIFGKSTDIMENVANDASFDRALTKLVVKSGYVEPIRQALFAMGFSDSMAYPDLDGLAREIKRQYGFRV